MWPVCAGVGGGHDSLRIFEKTDPCRPWGRGPLAASWVDSRGSGTVVEVGVQEKSGALNSQPTEGVWKFASASPTGLAECVSLSLGARADTVKGLYIRFYREIHEALGGKLAFFLR